MLERFVMILVALVLLAPLPSCNTVQGVGEDIRQAGSAISTTADHTRKEMHR